MSQMCINGELINVYRVTGSFQPTRLFARSGVCVMDL
jgi:hypothetical protein